MTPWGTSEQIQAHIDVRSTDAIEVEMSSFIQIWRVENNGEAAGSCGKCEEKQREPEIYIAGWVVKHGASWHEAMFVVGAMSS